MWKLPRPHRPSDRLAWAFLAGLLGSCAVVDGDCDLDVEHKIVHCKDGGHAFVIGPARSIEAVGEAAKKKKPEVINLPERESDANRWP